MESIAGLDPGARAAAERAALAILPPSFSAAWGASLAEAWPRGDADSEQESRN